MTELLITDDLGGAPKFDRLAPIPLGGGLRLGLQRWSV
jgi:hypothetical protein